MILLVLAWIIALGDPAADWRRLESAYAGLKSARAEGRIAFPKQPTWNFVLFMNQRNQYRMEIDGGRRVWLSDGMLAWHLENRSIRNLSVRETLNRPLEFLPALGILSPLWKDQLQVVSLEKSILRDGIADVYQLRLRDPRALHGEAHLDRVYDVFVHPATVRVLKVGSRSESPEGRPVYRDAIYEDYRWVGSFLFPFRLRLREDFQTLWELQVERWEINPPLPRSAFRLDPGSRRGP
ncbi:MAG: hypothetical protein HY652_13590 [Acidobacteria bacterium]|nr:hypothetical protein [Acidobacteriota bacterium]